MATIVTSKGNVEAHVVRVDILHNYWITASLNLDNNGNTPWTPKDIYEEADRQMEPWLDLASNFGLNIYLEDSREKRYTVEEET